MNKHLFSDRLSADAIRLATADIDDISVMGKSTMLPKVQDGRETDIVHCNPDCVTRS